MVFYTVIEEKKVSDAIDNDDNKRTREIFNAVTWRLARMLPKSDKEARNSVCFISSSATATPKPGLPRVYASYKIDKEKQEITILKVFIKK